MTPSPNDKPGNPAQPEKKNAKPPRNESDGLKRRKRRRITATVGGLETTAPPPAEEHVDFSKLIKVVERIKSSAQFPAIQQHILEKSNLLHRILMSSYFGAGIFREEGLTISEIELVAKSLGAPMRRSNIMAQLRRYTALFDIDGASVPERGVVMHYRPNQQGRAKLEKVLRGDR